MARFVHYRCPECRGIFRHLHHPSDSPPPDRCPLCQAWVSDGEPPEAVFVPQAPGIKKSAFAESVEQSYRAMEASSVGRAEEAGDLLERAYAEQGPPQTNYEADFRKEQVAQIKSELRVTNLREPSEMRRGDVAAIGNTAQAMANLSAMGSRPGYQQLSGREYAPGQTPTAADRDAVSNTLRDMRANHPTTAAAMIRAGNMGTYRE